MHLEHSTPSRDGLRGSQSDAETRSDVEPSSASSSVSEASVRQFQRSSDPLVESGGGAVVSGSPATPAASSSILIHEYKSSAPCQEKSYGGLEHEPEKQGIKALPRRLERYAAAHSRALEMASFLDRQQEKRLGERAENLRLCGSYLDFRHYFTVDQVRLHAAKFCQQDRLCPLCAIRRGSKLLKRYSARVLHIQQHAQLVPMMTTFTVKNGDDLSERFRHLSGSYSKLMERRKHHNSDGGRWTEAARAWGAVGSIEVKRGSGSGAWHPHLHAVWLCESEPDAAALSSEWNEITGDSHQIDVRPFEFVRAGLRPTMELLAADFAEVFKYALKFSTMDLSDNLEAFQRLYGKRMIKSHGVLYGIEAPEDLTDDPLEVDDLPFVSLLFRYIGGVYA